MRDNFEEEFAESSDYLISACTRQRVYPREINVITVTSNKWGQELIEYVCPICHEIHKSLVYGEY